MSKTVNSQEIIALKKYVRATNYLAVAQIYLQDNILLNKPLQFSDIKPRLLGHWGTCPGINFVYANINRLINKYQADFLYVVGPGHGFPAIQANLFIEKSLSKFYPAKIPYSLVGIKEICSKFSAPYGYPSHSNPAAPGAILEGGELGYSLSVSFGSVLDNPNLITCCLVGDGEAETGPLSASWQVNKLLNPVENGAVLPIVHINGYKISGPTFLGRMSNEELTHLFLGYGYQPYLVDADDTIDVYEQMAIIMDKAYADIKKIQNEARQGKDIEKPQWPVIILKTPKGWTGVKYDHNDKLEGNCLSHQVILGDVKKQAEHLKMLEQWLKSYNFNDLYQIKADDTIEFDQDMQSLVPPADKSCGQQKYTRGGEVMCNLVMPNLTTMSQTKNEGKTMASSMQLAGQWFKQILALNKTNNNFRIFSPDETYSNQIDAVFEETARCWQWPIKDFDTDLKRQGKVMEMLSEHTLFGLLHGYTVTGRHGVFVSYEAFVQVIASMADQYAKFIKASKEVLWRKPLPALNIILTSLLERQDHNGFSHQNPSFISSMMEKDGDIIFTYLPPDANCMLVTLEKSFITKNVINIIVAGKKPLPQWLNLEQAKVQMEQGIMTWDFASDHDPDVVLVASGDYVTQEALASITIIKKILPKLKIRFVNVSELTALGVGDPTTSTNSKFLHQFFTEDKGIVFNFHGYPQTIKKLLFDYEGCHRIKVNGYCEEGSTTTPFDMEIRNGTSRYHLVIDLATKACEQGNISMREFLEVKDKIQQKLAEHKQYILDYGTDPKEIEDWRWEE